MFIYCIVLSPLVLGKDFKISMNEFCPYHCTDSKGGWDKNHPGYAYEIYDEIYSSAGYDFKAIQSFFHGGMRLTDTGAVDAISGPIKLESKLESEIKTRQNKNTGAIYSRLIYSEEPISIYQSSCFFGKAGMKWKYKGIQSLLPYITAVVKDFDYGESLNKIIEAEATSKKNAPKIQLMYGKDIHLRNFSMLLNRRVDLVLADLQVGLYTINKMEKEQQIEKGSIKLLDCTDEGKRNLYVGFSPKRPKKSRLLAQLFDQGIGRLRSSGRLKLILDKYGLNDWVLEK